MFWSSVKKSYSYIFKTLLFFSLIFALSSCAYSLSFEHSSFTKKIGRYQQKLPAANDTPRTIKGTVTSKKDDQPLAGVSILVKNTKEGTTTDKKGRYSIDVSAGKKTLIFSFVGFKDKEVTISSNKTTINVHLQKKVSKLENVVVVGYGSQRREDLTGSISSISAADIKKQSITSPQQALQGQIAGVQVTKNSGAPGGGSTVRIRGTSSIRAGNNPLYVIDGLPVGGGSSPSQNPLSLINPQDIVSIEVLKDASATAIYGARGANGVILITTKRGDKGNTRVDFEAKYGISQIRKKLNLLNTQQFTMLANEAASNDGAKPVFGFPASNYPNTNWQDEVFRSAPQQNYQLSVSGGNEDTRYALSANFLNKKGILIGSGYKRGSFRINFNKQVSDNFTIGNNLIISQDNYNLIETGGRGLSGIVNGALQIPSVVPVKNETGNYVFQTSNTIERDNPVASALEKSNTNKRFKGVGNVYGEYMLTKNLEARVSIGGNLSYGKRNFYAPRTTLQGRQNNGFGSVSSSQSLRWINENTLTYKNNFMDLHKLTVLGGFTLEQTTGENLRGAASGFITDAFKYNNLNAGAFPNNPSTGANKSSLVSYLGRINYGFDERYLFTLTGRIDGSSRFGSGNRYGFFPSGAFAWRISNESFMEKQRVFSNLKLRLSYGITGNQEIGNYAALAQLGNSQVTFGDRIAVGINPASLGNKNLQWERTTQYNLGIDFGLFNERINLTADAYYKKTTDLLLSRRVPRYTGYSQYLDNIGSIENKGLELSLNTQNISKTSFTWSTSINYSMNRNEVLKLSDSEPLLVGTPISYAGGQRFRIIEEGQSLGSFYGYQYGGVYANQEAIDNNPAAGPSAQPGDPYLKDISGLEGTPDGDIDGNDRTILGNAFPDFTFGFTNDFFYKGFDLSIFIQGSYGNKVLNMNTLRLESVRGYTNQTTDVLNRWTPDNINTDIPQASRKRSSSAQTAMRAISNRLIEDGSYLRLKNVTFGYTFPVKWTQSLGTQSVRIYVSGQNLLTLTSYSGYDPEVSTYNSLRNLGADYGTYPKAKTYLMGIKLGF